MAKEFNKLMRQQIDETIQKIVKMPALSVPKKGWIRTLREALGMPSRILANRLGCSIANIAAIEQREVKETISLKTLQEIAQAMNCKLVYYLIPIESLGKILEDQARLVARKRIELVNHSMQLEQQGLTPAQLQQQEDSLVQELLQGDIKKLWHDI